MIRKILILLTLLLICAYLIAALTVLNSKPQGAVCQGVECIIKDSIQSAFINSQEVENILKSNKLYPKGKEIDSVVCRKTPALKMQNAIKVQRTVSALKLFKDYPYSGL